MRCSVRCYLLLKAAEGRGSETERRNAVLSSQWFAHTEIVLSFETDGPGKFTPEEIEALVERDENGRVAWLNLPKRSVLIANHQVRAREPGTRIH